MILIEFGPATAYRMHAPRWATAPTSGAGAAAYGGRMNRPGTPALYLALEPQTAVREYQQLSPLMPPGTLVSYTIRLASIVDFRGGYDSTHWAELWEEFHCDWRELWFNRRVEPPSETRSGMRCPAALHQERSEAAAAGRMAANATRPPATAQPAAM